MQPDSTNTATKANEMNTSYQDNTIFTTTDAIKTRQVGDVTLSVMASVAMEDLPEKYEEDVDAFIAWIGDKWHLWDLYVIAARDGWTKRVGTTYLVLGFEDDSYIEACAEGALDSALNMI